MWNLVKNELIKLKCRNKLLISFLVIAILFSLISIGLSMAFVKLNKAETKKSTNWRADVQAEITELESGNTKDNDTLESLMPASDSNQQKIQEDKYLLNHNIAPNDTKHQLPLDILKVIFSSTFLFMIIIIAILTSDIVSGEYTPPTMKVLLSRPVSRAKVLLSKFIAALISSSSIIIIIELLCFFVLCIVFGFPNPKYPMAMGTRYTTSTLLGQKIATVVSSSTYLIPLWLYLVFVFLMQLLFIVSCVAVFLMLSTLFKTGATSMTLSIIGTLILSIIVNIPYIKLSAPFLFLTYSNPFSYNLLGAQYSTSLTTIPMAIMILIAWTVGSYAIAHLVFTKHDILI